jgi:hypothetical protein
MAPQVFRNSGANASNVGHYGPFGFRMASSARKMCSFSARRAASFVLMFGVPSIRLVDPSGRRICTRYLQVRFLGSSRAGIYGLSSGAPVCTRQLSIRGGDGDDRRGPSEAAQDRCLGDPNHPTRPDHPSRPSATTCCLLSWLKTFAIPAPDHGSVAFVNVSERFY